MNFGGLTRVTLNDFPQRVACVAYTVGCNFRCPFCYNASLVLPERKPPLSLSPVEVMAFLRQRRGLLDGVVISGGEPTLWPELDKFLGRVKSLGFETMIETNGSHPEVVEFLWKTKKLDFVAVDYKIDFSGYEELVVFPGAAEKLKETIRFLVQAKIPFVLRTTLVPGLHHQQMVRKMARELKIFFLTEGYPLEDVNWSFQRFRPQDCLRPSFTRKKELAREIGEQLVAEARLCFSGAKLRL